MTRSAYKATYITYRDAEGEIILNKPVLLASLDDVVSSEILKDLLKENGIPFSCDTEDEGTLKVTFGGSFTADEIYVDDSDFERANQIYEDFINSEPIFDEEFFDEAENWVKDWCKNHPIYPSYD